MTLTAEKGVVSIVSKLREYLINTTTELVSIPTINPPGRDYVKMADFLFDEVKKIGRVEVDKIIVPDGNREYPRICVLGRMKGSGGGKSVHLNGHYDVVPPGATWSKDPLKPELIGGKLYGLGASDQKSGLTSILGVLRAFASFEDQPVGDISFSFTPDEETGGELGLGYLVKEGLVKSDYGIVTEPSMPDLVKIGHRGALWLEVSVFGKTAHGSMAFLGINAFEKSLEIVKALKSYERRVLRRRKTSFPVEFKQEKHPHLMIGGRAEGGVKVNVVPDRFAFTIDRRLLAEEKLDKQLREIIGVINKAKARHGLKINVKILQKAHSASIELDNPLATTLQRSHEEVTGKRARIVLGPGYMDLRYLIREAGIPSVSYGPGILRLAHQPDEYVLVDDLVKCTQVMALAVSRLTAA
jgi:succinyl-diaminopimelate desuccinylase